MLLLLNMGCGQSKHVASDNTDGQQGNNCNHQSKKSKGQQVQNHVFMVFQGYAIEIYAMGIIF